MVDAEEPLKLDRRAAIVGAACLAVSATVPWNAVASGSARAARRLAWTPPPRQSPIDLRRSQITFVRRLPRLQFRYPRRVDVRLVNTGSPDEFATVRAEVPAGAAHLMLGGVRWELEQFHWHTPSEHEVEGRHTPLEMHFVHTRADEAILVIAVFIERGRASAAIETMFGDLPEQPDETREVSDVALRGARARAAEVVPLHGLADHAAVHRARPVRRARRLDQRVQTPDPRLPRALRGRQQPRGAAAERAAGAKRRKAASTTTARGRPGMTR